MRTIGLLVLLAIGTGCGDSESSAMDGTGGNPFPPHPGLGGSGVGGAACDSACQVAALWQTYVQAASNAAAADAVYESAYSDALASASVTCGCTTMCDAAWSCPRNPNTTVGAIAMSNLAVVAANSARMDAATARDSAYAAYSQSAVAAGLTPMAMF